jgi:hypothetical protein
MFVKVEGFLFSFEKISQRRWAYVCMYIYMYVHIHTYMRALAFICVIVKFAYSYKGKEVQRVSKVFKLILHVVGFRK